MRAIGRYTCWTHGLRTHTTRTVMSRRCVWRWRQTRVFWQKRYYTWCTTTPRITALVHCVDLTFVVNSAVYLFNKHMHINAVVVPYSHHHHTVVEAKQSPRHLPFCICYRRDIYSWFNLMSDKCMWSSTNKANAERKCKLETSSQAQSENRMYPAYTQCKTSAKQ